MPEAPPTTIPSTVRHSIETPTSLIYNNPFVYYTYAQGETYLQNQDIIFVKDEAIFSSTASGNYLIAIAEGVRDFYGLRDERENNRP